MIGLVQRTNCLLRATGLPKHHQTFLQYETLALVSVKSGQQSDVQVFNQRQNLPAIPLNNENQRLSARRSSTTEEEETPLCRKSLLDLHRSDVLLNQHQIMLQHSIDNFRNENIVEFSSSNVTSFGSSQPKNKSSNTGEKKPDMDKMALELAHHLTNVFVQQSEWGIFHPNLVFEDRIRGKRIEGLMNYIKFVNLIRILAHIKFVYVRFHILKLTKHPEDGTIRIRWRIAGMGVMRLALRYIPDQMWKRGNMDKATPSWYDGYSTFHIDGNNKIYKHVADRRMPDEDKEPALNPVVEKLKKLKPAPAPSPAI